MTRSHKIRLNPTPEQATYFAKAAGTRRFVFNWGLVEWKRQYEAGEKPSMLALKKQFNAIKGELFPWVYDVTKCAVEGAFFDLGAAFKNFFEGIQSGRKVGYPKFKKKGQRDSFYLANDKFRVNGHTLHVPKLGAVNMTEALRFEGKILSATISRTADWWFVSIAIETQETFPAPPPAAVGIDVGLKRLATLSDRTWFENQKSLRRLKKLRCLSKALARKKLGSANRAKAKRALARLHYRIACVRDDTLHKLTTYVVQNYGLVAVESLNVKGMAKNRKLARALSDASLGKLLEMLKAKAQTRGVVVQPVGRFYPSSRTCSGCGVVRRELVLSEREFLCDACGMTMDRDLNAAVNLLREGLRLAVRRVSGFDETLNACGQAVRPTCASTRAGLDEAGIDLCTHFST